MPFDLSLLEGRKVSAINKFYQSKYHRCDLGLPQGSTISCIVFNVLVHDLPAALSEYKHYPKSTQYADDYTFKEIEDTEEKAVENQRRDYRLIEEWCIKNEMVINHSKTQVSCGLQIERYWVKLNLLAKLLTI